MLHVAARKPLSAKTDLSFPAGKKDARTVYTPRRHNLNLAVPPRGTSEARSSDWSFRCTRSVHTGTRWYTMEKIPHNIAAPQPIRVIRVIRAIRAIRGQSNAAFSSDFPHFPVNFSFSFR